MKNKVKTRSTERGADSAASKRAETDAKMPLSMGNYKLMLIGVGIIVIGFLLMAGGGSDDPNVFNESMFSFRRITLAPIVVLAGFGFEIYAIMKKVRRK